MGGGALVLAMIVVSSTIAFASPPDTYVTGKTQDCFAGKQFHPAQVDVYLFDPEKSREITDLLRNMQADSSRGDNESMSRFFASYTRLSRTVRRVKALAHVKSDKTGAFSFHDLAPGRQMIVLGISEREDDPAYYAEQRIERLQAGKNIVLLDFDRGESCH
jgi:hypothetical protein